MSAVFKSPKICAHRQQGKPTAMARPEAAGQLWIHIVDVV